MQISGANLLLASQRLAQAQKPFKPAPFGKAADLAPAKSAETNGKTGETATAASLHHHAARPGSQLNILI